MLIEEQFNYIQQENAAAKKVEISCNGLAGAIARTKDESGLMMTIDGVAMDLSVVRQITIELQVGKLPKITVVY